MLSVSYLSRVVYYHNIWIEFRVSEHLAIFHLYILKLVYEIYYFLLCRSSHRYPDGVCPLRIHLHIFAAGKLNAGEIATSNKELKDRF